MPASDETFRPLASPQPFHQHNMQDVSGKRGAQVFVCEILFCGPFLFPPLSMSSTILIVNICNETLYFPLGTNGGCGLANGRNVSSLAGIQEIPFLHCTHHPLPSSDVYVF